MNKQSLNITIDESCPDEIKANGIAWVEDACNWLLSQPRTTDAVQPRFSEIKFTIKPCGFGRGVRDVRDGRGTVAIDTGTDLKIEDSPKIISIPTTQEIAFRGNAVYLLSQLFRPDGVYTDSFRWEEHLHYQLKFLDRLAASNKAARSLLDQYEQQQAAKKEEERMAAYYSQYPTKRKLRLQKQAADRVIVVPGWWYQKYPDAKPSDHEATKVARVKPHYSSAPTQQPPLPPQEPVEHPTPQISAQDQAALDAIKAQQEYLQSFANTEKLEEE